MVQGTPYFIRVSAYNKIGYGPVVVTPRTYAPMVVPSLPTSVSLVSYSGTSLLVVFSAPLNNGGDGNITYRCVCALCLRGFC